MKTGGWFLLLALLVLFLFYIIGPTPKTPAYNTGWPQIPKRLSALHDYVEADSLMFPVKPGCAAEILWADSTPSRTDVAVVYLHGFSACHVEGNPVHRRFASHFGANLYLARLSDHGLISKKPLLNMTADRLWNSAREALAIGHRLGHKVILMGSSTGCTLALKLAAEFPDKVMGIINLSPNVKIKAPMAFLANDPWGLEIARLYLGDDSRTVNTDSLYNAYWNGTYRLEAVTQLEELVETSMTRETFLKIKCPVFSGYYYRDKAHHDDVIDIDAVKKMNEALGTPNSEKVLRAFPNADTHVIGSRLYSGAWKAVSRSVIQFGQKVLGLHPAKTKNATDTSLASS